MTKLTCDQCGATIDEANAADAGWLEGYYREGIWINEPLCDCCRHGYIRLNEIGNMEFVDVKP